MRPEPGRRVGPYQLVELIGEGGMGVVWKARDTALDRDVAIKFLPPAFARDAERLARFEREAKAVAALSHPGILAIYGFGEQDGAAYAVTELLEGQTLRDMLAAGPLAPAQVLDIARQVARALSAAHDRGVIHRDLKPENIFYTRDGRAKILDFGLAAYVNAADSSGGPSDVTTTPTRTSLTAPGVVLGTTDYLSPEQVRGAAADPRSDVFAFGAVLYEMMAGRRAFQRETPAETMTAILREDPPPTVVRIPPSLERVLAQCLAKSPESRYSSGRDLAAALDAATDAHRVRTVRALPVVLAAAAVIAVAAVLVIWKGRILLGGDAARPQAAGLSAIGEPSSPIAEANEYYEKGLLFLRAQLDIARAQKMLDRAIELDPSYGSARAMRSLSNLIAIHEGFSNDGGLVYASERAARDVLARQPSLPSAHATLGAALLHLNRKEQAREEFATALRLEPQSQPGAAWMMVDDRLSGRFEAAEAKARSMLQAVPLFWAARIMLSEVLFDQGRIEEAHREIEKVFEQDPTNLGAVRMNVRVHLYEGDVAGARAMLEKISAGTHFNFRVRLAWAMLLAREGDKNAAIAALDHATLKYADVALFAPAQAAEIYALMGETDLALNWLDRAVRNGDERASWLRRDVFLANIQQHPRFQMIVETIDRGRP